MTSRTIAQLSGVSQTTVSRVLRDDPKVSEASRARVLRVLEETKYAPNASARAMRTGSTGVIGVVAGSVTNPFYPELVEALNVEISRRDRHMSLWIAAEPPAREAGELAALAAVRGGAVDGVVFTTVSRQSPALHAALAQQAPVVLLNRTLGGLCCDTVSTDNVLGAEAVARYFVAHGRTHVAMITGPAEISTAREREEGFFAGLGAAGLAGNAAAIVRGNFTHASGHEAMRRLLRQTPRPDALFCVNDVVAFGALDAAREAGVSVPDDLWVVGFDDTEMATWAAFDLTTVRQPIAKLAEVGIDLLIERMRARDAPPTSRRLPADLVIRGSTGRAPSA
jgi:LacI family transcriptional regulator